METKVHNIGRNNGIFILGNKFEKIETLFRNSHIIAKVLNDNNHENYYTLYANNKKFDVYSNFRLISGENLNLKVMKNAKMINLKLLERFFFIGEKKDPGNIVNIWKKSNLFPLEVLNKGMENFSGKNVELSKILSLLYTYLPGLEWNIDTPYFYWNFSDGSSADGYLGKLDKDKVFYFKLKTKKLGGVSFYLKWNETDFSDLVIFSFFEKIEPYRIAVQKKEDFISYMSEYGITPLEIILLYTSESALKNNVEWEA